VPQEIVIGPAREDQLRPGAELLAASLGFGAADAIPPWLMLVAADAGGVALAAATPSELAGFSFGLPGLAGREPFLSSCGLAVAPAFRGRGIGRALKLAQRRAALDLGYGVIRWTADPLNGPGLRLYLSRLGARLVAYRAGLFDGVRPGGAIPQDDVEIEWRIDGPARPAIAEAGPRVAFPVGARSLRWRLAVREAVSGLLDAGWVGTGAELDERRRRWVLVFGTP
jgi:predicted GNAT superfamily acetyltransferase